MTQIIDLKETARKDVPPTAVNANIYGKIKFTKKDQKSLIVLWISQRVKNTF